jgi:hypothetical protein
MGIHPHLQTTGTSLMKQKETEGDLYNHKMEVPGTNGNPVPIRAEADPE